MFELTTGGVVSQAIAVVASLGVADALADGPRTATDLAEAVGADADYLFRVMRLLVGRGVFDELDGRRFALNPLARLLQSEGVDSMRSYAMLIEAPFRRTAWTRLLDSVTTGRPAFDIAHGRPMFQYFADHPDDAALFGQAMTVLSRQFIAAVLDAYDFSQFGVVVDVGGGNGALLAGILTANPGTRGILYDLPHVVERARELLERAGCADRCTVVAGDFFDSAPAGGDAYLLTHIVHDWDDEDAVRILRNCRSAMSADARLLLGESVLTGTVEDAFGPVMDMFMLAIGGRERTEAEYRDLLARAGLRMTRVIPSGGPHSVVEAVPD
jgi:hypothetical protein